MQKREIPLDLVTTISVMISVFIVFGQSHFFVEAVSPTPSPQPQANGEITEIARWSSEQANDIAWSHDGRTFAIATNKVWLHPVNEPNNRRSLTEDYAQPIKTLAWSPDNTQIAFGTEDGVIRIWDLATGEEVIALEGHSDVINSVAWSADGVLLASASDDLTVRVWEVNKGELQYVLQHESAVNAVDWSDATTLASGSFDGTVQIWNAASGERLLQLKERSGSVFSVAWSPDKTKLAMASFRATEVIDALTGETTRRFVGQSNRIAWSPDGKRLAAGRDDGRVRVWDIGTGATIYTSPKYTEQIRSLAWSLDENILALVGVDFAALLDADTGDILHLLEQTGAFSSAAWAPDGERLVFGYTDGTVRIGDISSGSSLITLAGHTGPVNSVTWSPNGKWLASASNDSTVRIWNADTGEMLRVLKKHTGKVSAVAWSHDSSSLASAGADGLAVVWDVVSGPLRVLQCGAGPVSSVAWSLNDMYLAFGCNSGTVQVWRTVDGEIFNTLTGENSAVKSLDWLPDNTRLIVAHANGVIQVRYAGDDILAPVLRQLNESASSVNSVAWSPDGTRFVVGSEDGTVRVWDAASGEPLQEAVSHMGSVFSVRWSPDGTKIVSTGADGIARVWNVPGSWPVFPNLIDSTQTLWEPGQDLVPYM